MTRLRIVEVRGGKFAVQKRGLLFWGYCDINNGYVWSLPSYIRQFCLLDSEAEAEEAVQKIIAYIDSRKEPKAIKIIKQVKV